MDLCVWEERGVQCVCVCGCGSRGGSQCVRGNCCDHMCVCVSVHRVAVGGLLHVQKPT